MGSMGVRKGLRITRGKQSNLMRIRITILETTTTGHEQYCRLKIPFC